LTGLAVHHFGPDISTVGGMATVIGIFAEHNVGGDSVDAYPTWQPSSPLSTMGAWVRSALALVRLPTTDVVHVHLSERGSFLREGPLVLLARRRGLATIATIHGASFIPFAYRRPRVASAVLRSANLVTCLDRDTLAHVKRLAPDTPSVLVPNPIFVDARLTPADTTDEVVVFAGEIGRRKGADVLCRAWDLVVRQRPNARCVMIGPVADFAPPSTKRLRVLPPVGRMELMHILRDARVIALPSRAEGMPMVLAEAMSLGRPVVSTPVGAVRELVDQGGFIVPVGDEIRLAARLVDLLSDPELARAIGEQGRRFCAETRSIEVLDARFRELYEAAVSR
jgi:glycosyltransferase involved in cell wall biosynthesis